MPIAVRGVISYTLTDEELAIGRDLRRKRGEGWDFTEMEEFDSEIRSTFKIPSGFFDHPPITNFMELFDDN